MIVHALNTKQTEQSKSVMSGEKEVDVRTATVHDQQTTPEKLNSPAFGNNHGTSIHTQCHFTNRVTNGILADV